ncbi:uncharacterized protein Z520_04763 [Fonsecaea multimorphosa CBS 102226]|uniref:Uncharacterized protein n=1 Tax=Fonsecaea multimorphosa CBS 102226 TaxID=1442371 RepID=A0A0D2K051_9EURO|nr:uncharacterized protein Z520_04763 [Fonsecaea multimorphosa CBS 102226]KIX99187.1 hypothetical protein Z520_04763 [Fonsecaea multimorphosa CBS 102226]OAL25884.1 hypothetical protein AYO22_04511 [Fonsecaea multimorphosa]
MASPVSRIQVGTDVLDLMSVPEIPHGLIADYLGQIGSLLPAVNSSEHTGDPDWHNSILHEALKVVNMICPPVLRRRPLWTPQGTWPKCHLLASLIPARYFPESGTVMDRFFAGLISFLENQHRFIGRHAMDMKYQQEDLSTSSTRTSNASRRRVGRYQSNSHSKRRKPHAMPKASPNKSVSDDTKQEIMTSQYDPEAAPKGKRERNMEKSPFKAIQTSSSKKRKSLDEETPIKDRREKKASTEDPTPSKKKKKQKRAARTSIEPTAPLPPSTPHEPRVVIKLEDSADEKFDEGPDEEPDEEFDEEPDEEPDEAPDNAPRPLKKRNVYEYMYHNAQEEIRFLEKFLLAGAGVSKADIDASKIRVAMGQSHKRAFEQVYKPSEKK